MGHTLTVAPYGAVVTFSRTKVGWLGHAPDSPVAGLAGAFLSLQDGRFLIGWFDGRISTLVHECVHAAEAILRYYDVPPKGEALAYLTEYLFAQGRKLGR